MIILSWNVRRLRETVKRAGVKDFFLLNHADIMCFQETKLASVSPIILRSIAISQVISWIYVTVEGSARRLLTGRQSQRWTWQSEMKGIHSLSVTLKDNKDSSLWAISNVYGPHSARERLFMAGVKGF